MRAPGPFKGFTVTPVEAFQIRCDRCGKSHVLTSNEALDWAQEHYGTHRTEMANLPQPDRSRTQRPFIG